MNISLIRCMSKNYFSHINMNLFRTKVWSLEEMDDDVDAGFCPDVRNSLGERYAVSSVGMQVSDDVLVPQVIAESSIPDSIILIQ
mgnify:FL=1